MNPQRPATGIDTPLDIRVERRPEGSVLFLSGSASMDRAELLRTRLVELLDEKSPRVVLELSALAFIESSSLGSIVAAYVRARRQGGSIRLVNPVPSIRELLQTTRLTELLPIFPSLSDALSG